MNSRHHDKKEIDMKEHREASLQNHGEKVRQEFGRALRVVVKVGTSVLTYSDGLLNLLQIERLVRELASVANQGREVVLVTSGAVGAGMGRMGWKKKPKTLPEKQAAAAVGQGILMHVYEKLFAEYGRAVAQVLLTRADIADRKRYLNARRTLMTLLSYGVIPIVNENDVVAVDEIRVGDNDTLSAMVASLVDADLLVLLTDTEGVYTKDPKSGVGQLIGTITEITPDVEAIVGGEGSPLGTGGMSTKLAAARMAMNSGIPMVVAKGESGALERILEGKPCGTLFVPVTEKPKARKRWIAFGSTVQGKLYVDRGASDAITRMGKSLLPMGIIGVEGSFEAGAVVSVCDREVGEVARGIANYSSDEITRIMGHHTSEISKILGEKDCDEVIHRDNMKVMRRGG